MSDDRKNRFCEIFALKWPIVQAGMVWASEWPLAVASSEAGILGTIGTGAMRMDAVNENVRKAADTTEKPFAVNIPLLRPDAMDVAKTALDAGAKIFITAAGNPVSIVPFLKDKGCQVLHVVPSVKGAKKAESCGVDAVICEGYEAGGHNSPLETTTLVLTPLIADAVSVPVIAAGGIADGRGMAAALALGADGVQMGTRFIATKECNVHDNYKRAIVDATDGGTCMLGRRFLMLRVLRSAFPEKMEKLERDGATDMELQKLLKSEGSRNMAAAVEGDVIEGTMQAGQSSAIVTDIPSVKDLVARIISEYEAARNSLSPLG